MLQGQIIKGIGGLYSVYADERLYLCKARGKFRNDKLVPLVGDYVKINDCQGSCVIEEILERKNSLIRPPVANVENIILVFSLKNPDINYMLLDKFLVMLEEKGIDLCICINKIDVADKHLVEYVKSVYELAGYKVILVSAKQNIGIDDLKAAMKDKVNVIAGPSGVGKSSILNKVQEGLKLQTGDLSSKTGRGKHTTRAVELYKLDFGGYILDTPGFTSLDIDNILAEDLKYYYRDINEYTYDCKYTNCTHITEDKCAVKQAVVEGKISKDRYERYVEMYVSRSRK